MSLKYIVEKFEKDFIEKNRKDIPKFDAGDTISVKWKIVENNKERIQTYEGVVIAIRNRGIGTSITVRKISKGRIGCEIVLPLYSDMLDSISVKKYGKVRRAKLYYVRYLSGRKARIKEDKIREDKIGLNKKQHSEPKNKIDVTTE